MAHEASTAEASVARGDPPRPNTTRAPSARRAAQIHSPSGHGCPPGRRSPWARSGDVHLPPAASALAATSGRKAHGRWATRCSSAGEGGRHGRSSEARDGAGRASASGRMRSSSAPPGATALADRHGGQIGGRHAHPQGGTGDRAGRGADDQVGVAGVPPGLSLQSGQHARLVRLADHAARPRAPARLWVAPASVLRPAVPPYQLHPPCLASSVPDRCHGHQLPTPISSYRRQHLSSGDR